MRVVNEIKINYTIVLSFCFKVHVFFLCNDHHVVYLYSVCVLKDLCCSSGTSILSSLFHNIERCPCLSKNIRMLLTSVWVSWSNQPLWFSLFVSVSRWSKLLVTAWVPDSWQLIPIRQWTIIDSSHHTSMFGNGQERACNSGGCIRGRLWLDLISSSHSWFTTIVDGNELGSVYPFQLKQLKYKDP